MANPEGPRCRHCRRNKRTRPRGLCSGCSERPEVRALYPSESKFARAGVRDFNGRAPLPAEPTEAESGTPERVAVLIERAQGSVALFHPQDARRDLR